MAPESSSELPFSHLEKVEVASSGTERSEFNGLHGAIIALGKDDQDVVWYGVWLYELEKWEEFLAEELISLGGFERPRFWLSDQHIRVKVNEKGEGVIVGEYEDGGADVE